MTDTNKYASKSFYEQTISEELEEKIRKFRCTEPSLQELEEDERALTPFLHKRIEDLVENLIRLENKVMELQDYIEKSLFLISQNIEAAHTRIKLMELKLEGKIFTSQYHLDPKPNSNNDWYEQVKKEGEPL